MNYRIDRNNYHQKPKNSNIQTPPEVSQFIFELLRDKISTNSLIIDPCSGQGSLLRPWKKAGYPTWGIDIDPTSNADTKTNFFTLKPCPTVRVQNKSEWNLEAKLVLCNPPFNGYKGKAAAEVWLDKIIELFGKEVPIVLFISDDAYVKNGDYPKVSSRITLALPKNFHSEILIFNIKGLQPHYFFNPHEPL